MRPSLSCWSRRRSSIVPCGNATLSLAGAYVFADLEAVVMVGVWTSFPSAPGMPQFPPGTAPGRAFVALGWKCSTDAKNGATECRWRESGWPEQKPAASLSAAAGAVWCFVGVRLLRILRVPRRWSRSSETGTGSRPACLLSRKKGMSTARRAVPVRAARIRAA